MVTLEEHIQEGEIWADEVDERLDALEAKSASGDGIFPLAIAAASAVLVGLEVIEAAGIIPSGPYETILLAGMAAIAAFVGRKRLTALAK